MAYNTSPEQIKCVFERQVTFVKKVRFMLQLSTTRLLYHSGDSDLIWKKTVRQVSQTIVYVICVRQSLRFVRFEGHLTMKMLNLSVSL